MKNKRKNGILDMFANPGIIQPISTADLHSGLPYQRPVKQRHVNKLVREWNPTYLTPIEVSYRDGKYNVVNGQHRISYWFSMAGASEMLWAALTR